jgi:hypothetical protein
VPLSAPGDMNISDLIRTIKGDARRGGLTYDQLAARAPIDPDTGRKTPGADRLEQMVNYPLKAWPDPPTMRGLAVILQVTEQVVIDACARSLGLGITRTRNRVEALLPEGIDELPDDQIRAVLSLLHGQIQAQRREAAAQEASEDPDEPPADDPSPQASPPTGRSRRPPGGDRRGKSPARR